MLTVQSVWTAPPAPACFARTGWDISPAKLALLASLAPTVLLNATQSIKVLNLSRIHILTKQSLVGHLKYLVGHVKRPPYLSIYIFKNPNFLPNNFTGGAMPLISGVKLFCCYKA